MSRASCPRCSSRCRFRDPGSNYVVCFCGILRLPRPLPTSRRFGDDEPPAAMLMATGPAPAPVVGVGELLHYRSGTWQRLPTLIRVVKIEDGDAYLRLLETGGMIVPVPLHRVAAAFEQRMLERVTSGPESLGARMARMLGNARGVVLPLALMMLVLLSALTAALLVMSTTEPVIARNQLSGARAQAAADSAVEMAVLKIAHGTAAPFTVSTSFGSIGSAFDLDVVKTNATDWSIVATGKHGNARRKVQVTVQDWPDICALVGAQNEPWLANAGAFWPYAVTKATRVLTGDQAFTTANPIPPGITLVDGNVTANLNAWSKAVGNFDEASWLIVRGTLTKVGTYTLAEGLCSSRSAAFPRGVAVSTWKDITQ